jgi:pilus assembly protein Flp/PilA
MSMLCARFVNLVMNFLGEEDGPTSMEYSVMLALIIAVCVSAITTLGTYSNTTFTSLANAFSVSSS